ncbi:MAG: hypothetical protein KC609_25930, partial [Myxococcales bacterium]|nr:hypothetical protein [Myxococcales bacterium]
MRILFAAEAEMNEVSGIASALRARAGVRVALGTTLFWDVWRCDVCHLFWPNARMALEPIDETLTRLDQRLLRVREQAMIVVSRRNPPIGTPRTEERQRLEHTLYRRAHAIVHPGPGSRDELSLR